MMLPFALRPARTEDITAICALWTNHEDILAHLPIWMSDPAGQVIVASAADRVIGMQHYTLVTPTEAWLDEPRSDPAWHGRGVDLALCQRGLELAGERGAAIARSSTAEGNDHAQHVLQQAGFAQIGAYVLFAGATGTTQPDPQYVAQIRQPGVAELDTLWDWLERSNVASLTGGLVMYGTAGCGLSDTVLAAALEDQQVWLIEGWGEIQSLMLAGPQRGSPTSDHFTIRYLDGTAEGISRLALHLRAVALERGFALIEARPPDLLIIHDALNGAGLGRATERAQLVFAREV